MGGIHYGYPRVFLSYQQTATRTKSYYMYSLLYRLSSFKLLLSTEN